MTHIYMLLIERYWVTHEVFEVTYDGRWKFDMGKDHLDYAMVILRQLFEAKMKEMVPGKEQTLSVDHLCELIMTYMMLHEDSPFPKYSDSPFINEADEAKIPKIDEEMFIKAVKLVMDRRNNDGSFGKHFRNPDHIRVKIGMKLHVTSVCLRSIVLATRIPSIHRMLFKSSQCWWDKNRLSTCERFKKLKQTIDNHTSERVQWLQSNNEIPDIAKQRRIDNLEKERLNPTPSYLRSVVGNMRYSEAVNLMQEKDRCI